VLRAVGRPTPAFARNRGAFQGENEWLIFLDADVLVPADLLDRYFEELPGARTALIGGGVIDEPAPVRGPAVAARYAYLRRHMSQEHSFSLGEWSYPKTVNVACRRSAFEEIGGFREELRAGEDADLTYRLRAAGWEVERRERAVVVHRSRQTVRGFIKQKAIHGSGGAWLDAQYPGSFPARRRPGLVWWGLRKAVTGVVSAAWSRDRDKATFAVLEPLAQLAWEFGRSLPNVRGLGKNGLRAGDFRPSRGL